VDGTPEDLNAFFKRNVEELVLKATKDLSVVKQTPHSSDTLFYFEDVTIAE